MLAPALDHLGRPAQIYVHIAVIQRAGVKMIGDMAGQQMPASRARTGGAIGELRDTRCERLDPFDLDKIRVVARAVKAMRWNDLSRGATHWIESADEEAQAFNVRQGAGRKIATGTMSAGPMTSARAPSP